MNQEYEYEYYNETIEEDCEEIIVDYAAVGGLVLEKFDFGDDQVVSLPPVVDKRVVGPFSINSKEGNCCERDLFIGDEEVSQYDRNDKKEYLTVFTLLEKQASDVLEPINKDNAKKVLEELQEEWVKNGARGILTDWPSKEVEMMDIDYDKVHKMNVYDKNMKVKNKFLYEMYAYLLYLEDLLGFKLIWSKHWRAMKYVMMFANYDFKRYYMRLLRKCDDKFFQQYVNLISLIYNWGLIFSYPYVEKYNYKNGSCVSQAIVMTPNLDDFGEGVNKTVVMSKIGVAFGSSVTYVDYDICEWLPNCNAREMVALALVCKGWYSRVECYVAGFKQYSKYLGSYAFGVGLSRLCPVRRSHDISSPYAGTFFGQQICHENYDCDDCTSGMNNGELDVESCGIDADKFIEGYNAIIYVNIDMLSWLEGVMGTLPMKYRKVYDKLFCVTPGHFACIYESVIYYELHADMVTEFVKFYDQDFLFHMILPFVPGAVNWSWTMGSVHGKSKRKFEEVD